MSGKVIFFGTSAVCIPYLEELKKNFEISLIVTQPDKRGGRNRKQSIVPAVKSFALENSIELMQPEKLRCHEVKEKIREIDPLISVVISYGRLIPPSVYKIPKYKSLNVHYSSLPLYRGAAPVQRALENGDKKIAVSIFELAKKMDSGDIWASKEIEIEDKDTTLSLWKRMSDIGAPFLIETLNKIFKGEIKKKEQNHNLATFAPPILKEESLIDFKKLSAEEIINKLRAFTPWPGVCFKIQGKMFKLVKAKKVEDKSYNGGEIISVDEKGMLVACKKESLLIELFQPECKKAMEPICYKRGNSLPKSL